MTNGIGQYNEFHLRVAEERLARQLAQAASPTHAGQINPRSIQDIMQQEQARGIAEGTNWVGESSNRGEFRRG